MHARKLDNVSEHLWSERYALVSINGRNVERRY